MADDKDPLVINSTDVEQIRTAQKRRRKMDLEHIARIQRVLLGNASPEDGQYVFQHYIHKAGVLRAGRAPIEELQFREGQRNLGIAMLHDVEQAAPQLIPLMIRGT